ncbi:hypothetical protein [Neobacillus niacini]|nr:hypothetical protein [Neobacillus niacini]
MVKMFTKIFLWGGKTMTDYSVVLIIGSILILSYFIGYTIIKA